MANELRAPLTYSIGTDLMRACAWTIDSQAGLIRMTGPRWCLIHLYVSVRWPFIWIGRVR
jgi:hypothetical protein